MGVLKPHIKVEHILTHPFNNQHHRMLKRLANERKRLPETIQVTDIDLENPTCDRTVCWELRVQPEASAHDPLIIRFTFGQMYPFREPLMQVVGPPGILDNVPNCHTHDGMICISDFIPIWSFNWTVLDMVKRLQTLIAEANH